MNALLSPQISPSGPAPAPAPALSAYENCAPYYDLLTADYDHETWLERVLELAEGAGFAGRTAGVPGRHRILDVGCGTGKSALPLVRRGYEVWACDLSPAMTRRARMRLGARATVFVADMRSLPDLPQFDLITCLDDAVNYLTGEGDLDAAMASFARALAPDGVAVFDVNTVSTYRDLFSAGSRFDTCEGRLRWSGQGRTSAGHYRAIVEPVGSTGQTGRASVHVQRHHSQREITAACTAAGLELVRVVGQSTGCEFHNHVDEGEQSKLLYVVRRERREVTGMLVKP
jgi:SAM-dependent methyltransferase